MTPAPSSSEPDGPDITNFNEVIDQCTVHTVGAMPVISGFCHKIGIAGGVNAHINSQANVDPGTLVTAMVINTLCGRSPLYRVEDFWKHLDTELLLGTDIPAESLNDDALGRTLDRVHTAGSMKIFTDIALKACRLFDVDTSQGQFDTTSITLWGEYASSKADTPAPHVTYGYSKDKRPDLKQVMFSMLCVEGNIPLLGQVEDGNSSDNNLNNEHLQHIAKLIKEDRIKSDHFLYVADSKLVTEANLAQLGDEFFITRLPATYKAHSTAIDAAIARADIADWQFIGKLNQTPDSKNRPAAVYCVAEEKVELYGREYRAIVVHSTNHDKRRRRRIERENEKCRKLMDGQIKQARCETFACKDDAENALEKMCMETRADLWMIKGECEGKNIYKRGRVKEGEERKVDRVEWRLCLRMEENAELQAQLEQRAGCFVLLTNTPPAEPVTNPAAAADAASTEKAKPVPTWDSEEVLRAYKEQHGIERNFSFLKEPLIANDVFLKKPGRIEALGLILLLALLVWSLMQKVMRQSVADGRVKLTDLDKKPTKRPTAFIMLHKFEWVKIVKYGSIRRLPKDSLTSDQMQYLWSLGLNHRIFTEPPGSRTG